MKRSEYLTRALEALSEGRITEEVYDAMLMNADVFCDDDDDDDDDDQEPGYHFVIIQEEDGNGIQYVIFETVHEKYFAGYDPMGGDEWTEELMEAYWMDFPEAIQIRDDLVAAE